MSDAPRGGIRSALAWLIFPAVPAVIGGAYHQTLNFGFGGGPDPVEWSWGHWVVLCGPLVGYGFLVGATLGLSDGPDPRRSRRWLARRWVWVAVGPWVGFLSAAAVFYAASWLPAKDWNGKLSDSMGRALGFACIGWLAYAWLLVAFLALRRAKRRGRFLRSLQSGLIGAIVLVGSLFGTFWAVTAAWREYFFDKRMMPLVLATASLALTSGCASTLTRGEVRRRDLFQAMLTAWLLGAALAWRWWSRSRSKDVG